MKQLIIFIAIIAMCSCCSLNRNNDLSVVSKWIGKELIFPETVFSTKFEAELNKAHYSMIYYIDSTVCLSCRLFGWESLINSMEDSVGHPINSALVISSNCDSEIINEFNTFVFYHPTFLDNDNVFNSANNFPMKDMLNAVLINQDRKVIVIGNPLINHKIRNLYIKTIKEMDKELNVKTELTE